MSDEIMALKYPLTGTFLLALVTINSACVYLIPLQGLSVNHSCINLANFECLTLNDVIKIK